ARFIAKMVASMFPLLPIKKTSPPLIKIATAIPATTSIHNLAFTVRLVDRMRQAILDETFIEFKTEFLAKYQAKALD
ncbi:MAG: Queuine tRNA-ribosyltransferase, partial [Actinomycetota bacterium]